MNLREVLDLLVEGQFICIYTHPDAYQLLQNTEFQAAVNQALKPFDKVLQKVNEHGTESDTFYCSYSDMENTRDMRRVRSQFEKMRDVINPIVDFITLVLRVEERDATLFSGERLHYSELLHKISDNSTFQSELKRLAKHRLFSTQKKNPDVGDRLIALFEGMIKEGYLKLENSETKVYTVTGKMEYFYQCIHFICEYEAIPIEMGEDTSQGVMIF